MSLFPRNNPSPQEKPEKEYRSRSLPSAHHYRVAVSLCAIHYLCLLAMVTTGLMLLLYPNQQSARILIATAIATIGTWFIALLKRRTTVCPLCKGTPLIASGALVHKRARRLPPLNHAVSTILGILFRQRFRCMYCGTDYDLLKESTRRHMRPHTKRRWFSFTRKD